MRPLTPSRLASEERIRCDIMNALEDALAQMPSPPPSKPPIPCATFVIPALENPFLATPTSSDPPPPWTVATREPRRRFMLPFVALSMMAVIGLGLCSDRHARAELTSALASHATELRPRVTKAVARHVRAPAATKVLAHRGSTDP